MGLKSKKDIIINNEKKIKKKNTKKLPMYSLQNYTYQDNNKIKVVAYVRVSTKAEAQKTSIKDNQPAYIKSVLDRKNKVINRNIKEIDRKIELLEERIKETNNAAEIKKIEKELENEKSKKKSKENKKYELISIYPESYTGTKILRPVFKDMLLDAGIQVTKTTKVFYPDALNPSKEVKVFQIGYDIIKGGKKYDEIWVKSTSRFSRNIDIVDVLRLLDNQEIIVRFLDIGMDTEKDSLRDISIRIGNDMNYSDMLSRDISEAKKAARERREILGNGREFGYDYHRKSSNKKAYYTVIEKEAKIIRFIYDVYLNGYNGKSYGKETLTKLLKENLPEFDNKPIYNRNGEYFSSSTVYNILTNKMYKGIKELGTHLKDPSTLFDLERKIISTKKDIVTVEDERVPEIIPKDTWDKVQDKLSENVVEKNGKKMPVRQGTNKYSEYLICGYCGDSFRYDNNSGNPFYYCATKKDKGVEVCNVINVYVRYIDAYIKNLIDSDYQVAFRDKFEYKMVYMVNYIEKYLKNIVNPKNVRYKKELQKKKENTEKIISALVASENPTDFILESISTKTKELSKYEDALKEINTPVLDKINKVKNMFVKIENLIDSYKKIPEIYTEEEILNNTEKFEVFGKRTKNDFSPTEPIFVPHFKNSPDYLIKNKLNELGIDLPKYNFIPVSGLEHAEFYEDCRENLELNKALKEYVSNFDTIEEAQKYSSTDNSISEELSAYILYFNSKEEALSDNKLSFYDKDMVKEDDIVIPKKSTLKSVELDYDMDDLNLMYGDNVETFNEDGEIVEDIGYLFDMGVEGSDNFTQLTNKIETLKKVLKSIEDKYK